MNKKIILPIFFFIISFLLSGCSSVGIRNKILSKPETPSIENTKNNTDIHNDLNKSGYCNIDSDCKKIAGYDDDGCYMCTEHAGNIFDENNYIFGKPSYSSKCKMLDCYAPPTNHPACVNNQCVLVENSTILDCENNVQCLLIIAEKNNDQSICEIIKALSPGHYNSCLFRFTKSTEDCNELSKRLNLSINDSQVQKCFIYNAKIKIDCDFIKEAYEKNKCLADTATKIRDCEFIGDTKNGRSWCYTRTSDIPPESIDDCNLLLEIDEEPINCINNFIRYNSAKINLKDSCYKLKNKKSVDYCLSQTMQY